MRAEINWPKEISWDEGCFCGTLEQKRNAEISVPPSICPYLSAASVAHPSLPWYSKREEHADASQSLALFSVFVLHLSCFLLLFCPAFDGESHNLFALFVLMSASVCNRNICFQKQMNCCSPSDGCYGVPWRLLGHSEWFLKHWWLLGGCWPVANVLSVVSR